MTPDLVDAIVQRFEGQAKAFDARAVELAADAPSSDAGRAWAAAAAKVRALAAEVRRDTAELTAEQFAALHRTTPQSVRAWCAAGRVPSARRLASGEWRIPRGAEVRPAPGRVRARRAA